MRNILEEIIQHKKVEVANARLATSIQKLEKEKYFNRTPLSIKKALRTTSASGVIAEFKRKSPSKGDINRQAQAEEITLKYQNAGVTGLSILTDSYYFGGNVHDIVTVRERIHLPILRKDFVVDEYQIIEAKAIGADVILLLANVLSPAQTKSFTQLAHQLGLEVLLEIREKEELENHLSHSDAFNCIGINNRNLKDFSTGVETSYELGKYIPDMYVKISESAIDRPDVVNQLKDAGFQGFLIGEYFMKQSDPGLACEIFIKELKKIISE